MASLKRIGAELDVSYTLVSKVLSGRLGTTGVSAATRDAILKKAKELNYVPNRLAVALKSGRKGAVGIFFHHLGTPGSDVSDRLLKGLADGLAESSTRLWLRFFQSDAEFVAACDAKLRHEIDGLIVAGISHPGLKKKLLELERQNVPVVTVLTDDLVEGPTASVTSVRVNYFTHGFLATAHLLERGCRHLACLASVETRTQGFIQAHQRAKVKIDRRLIVPTKEAFFHENGRDGLLTLLKSGVPFDGIVCQSDSQAVGVINELVRRGIKVPEEVKVTGVDNSPMAETSIVQITSVTSEMRVAGLQAVQMLLQKIDRKKVKSALIEPRLIVRASSGGGDPSEEGRS